MSTVRRRVCHKSPTESVGVAGDQGGEAGRCRGMPQPEASGTGGRARHGVAKANGGTQTEPRTKKPMMFPPPPGMGRESRQEA